MERSLTLFFQRYGLHDATPMYRASVSFFCAYWLHIPVQHLLHALLVYGLSSINTAPKYWTTLAGMFSALALASVGSTAFHTYLLSMGISKNVAFFMTLYSFSILNYFVIGFIVHKSSNRDTASAKSAAATTKMRGGASSSSSSSLAWSNNDNHCSKKHSVLLHNHPKPVGSALLDSQTVALWNVDPLWLHPHYGM